MAHFTTRLSIGHLWKATSAADTIRIKCGGWRRKRRRPLVDYVLPAILKIQNTTTSRRRAAKPIPGATPENTARRPTAARQKKAAETATNAIEDTRSASSSTTPTIAARDKVEREAVASRIYLSRNADATRTRTMETTYVQMELIAAFRSPRILTPAHHIPLPTVIRILMLLLAAEIHTLSAAGTRMNLLPRRIRIKFVMNVRMAPLPVRIHMFQRIAPVSITAVQSPQRSDTTTLHLPAHRAISRQSIKCRRKIYIFFSCLRVSNKASKILSPFV